MYMNPGADPGFRGQSEANPGSLGQMDVNYGAYGGGGYDGDTFEEEQPLLKELGVDMNLIKQKVGISLELGGGEGVHALFYVDSQCAESHAKYRQ